jgi:hypothetical protein
MTRQHVRGVCAIWSSRSTQMLLIRVAFEQVSVKNNSEKGGQVEV